jgi:ketosteroid isomerase-like protein
MIDNDDTMRVATRLFEAVEKGDLKTLEACYSRDAVLRMHAAGADLGRSQILELVSSLSAAIPDFRYDQVRQSVTDTGFVRQHTMVGTSPTGAPFEVPVCCVGRLLDGQVQLLEEYGDSLQLAALGL